MAYKCKRTYPPINDVPLRTKDDVRTTVRRLLPGQSFVVRKEGQRIYALMEAQLRDIRLVTRKLPDGRYRCWRLPRGP